MKSEFHPERLCAILVLLAALPACDGGNKQETKGTAGGEVLESSVTDAMLPVDTVRSQPPLAPKGGDGEGPGRQAGKQGGGGATAEPGDAAGEQVPAGEPAAADSGDDAPAELMRDAE